ncbi:MAG: tetratricopeptide repeat protein [Chitinophagaceae bacterium]|nr:tetratricopeptide repeat protein [Chitinophagaceae bacterium]
MKRVLSLLVTVAFLGSSLYAQSVDDGRKFLYYERYKSAKETFEKVLASDPNNIDAIYWLGQTLLDSKDSTAAKDLYQKALTSNGNAPLILIGMGQIMLMEGKKDEARQQFETAINLTKGKDVEVLNAIANANVKARAGDPTYAIEKLKQAEQTRKFKNANTYLIMGNAYRKLIDGGNAVTAYNKALELDPKLAAAKNGIGKIYETQKNQEHYLRNYEEAIQIDPAYAPAYFNLFYHYYFRDVNKAGEYLNKYIANTDQGPETEYIQTDYTYAKGDFAGARQKAESLIQQYGQNVNPRMYRMVAFTADTLGDLAAAKTAMDTFLVKSEQGPDVEDIKATDYEEMAKITSKLPGMEDSAYTYYEQAIAMDTVVANKLKLIESAAAWAKASGKRTLEADLLGMAYKLQQEPSARDLYNWAYAHYQAGNYPKADSLFCGDYVSKYPDQIYGYLWCARAKQAQDTSMQKGLAVDAYKTLAVKAVELDTSGNGQLLATAKSALFYLVSYYNDIAKEKDTAIYYNKEVLKLDPNDENAKNIDRILTAPPKKATTQSAQKGAATKPKTPPAKKKS